jgi:hypothetical protein
VCICVHMCAYVCICVHMCAYIYICVYMCAYLPVDMRAGHLLVSVFSHLQKDASRAEIARTSKDKKAANLNFFACN